jgi:diacylglycerol kinase (ATP)
VDHFVESAGVGLFAGMIREAKHEAAKLAPTGALDERSDRLAFGAEMLRRVLTDSEPMSLRVEADGKDLSGSFLMVESMNITSIGPCVRLAPEADHAGDFLDLVLAREDERPLLEAYFAWLGDCTGKPSPIPTTRVRRVTMQWPAAEGHLDDQLWPAGEEVGAASGEVTLEIETLLPLLIPAQP